MGLLGKSVRLRHVVWGNAVPSGATLRVKEASEADTEALGVALGFLGPNFG